MANNLTILAWATAFILTSFLDGMLVERQTARNWTLRFDSSHEFISNIYAAVFRGIEIVIVYLIAQFWLEPYVYALYQENIERIAAIAVGTFIGFFLNVWRLTGITNSNRWRALFVILAIIAGLGFGYGLKFFDLFIQSPHVS